MKIVFDTNVLLSGFLTATGPSQYVLNQAWKKHEVILSTYILEEFERILSEKLQVPMPLSQKALIFLKQRAVILEVKENKSLHFSDKKDIPILSLVELARPDCFVTGDKKLLQMKRMGHTLFLTPRELMEALTNKD